MSYGQQVAQLTSLALEQGVSPVEIIQNLEMVKLEVANSFFTALNAKQAEPEQPRIVRPGGAQ